MTSFDTIIVGAGSSGCTLAARLSERPDRRVLLLEAGPDYRAAELPDELRYLSRPVKWPHEWGDRVRSIRGRELDYLRGRGVGGSSATNGGVAIRPEPADFDAWPAGWGWQEMLPCLRRIETDLDFGADPWHGSDGPIPVVRAAHERWTPLSEAFYAGCLKLGLPECPDHNAPGATGVGPIPMNRVGGERISCSVAYLEPARARANLTVRGGAHAARVAVDGGRAVGVELLDGELVPGAEVVLCAGVIQSPLLLWRSGVGPADALRDLGIAPLVDLPAVGRHWTDHVVVNFPIPLAEGLVPGGSQPLENILRTAAPGSELVNDLNVTPWVQRGESGGLELVYSVSLQLPEGEASVRPSDADPLAPARIEWPFAGPASNARRLREGWRLTARLTEASGVAASAEALRGVAFPDDAELDEHIARTHGAFYHGVGTCGMGEEESAVVDTACRVRGLEGLRVVDCSIAPRVPRTNTNFLAIALAERAAELSR